MKGESFWESGSRALLAGRQTHADKPTALDVFEADVRRELDEAVLVLLVHCEDFANELQIHFLLVVYVRLVVQRVRERAHRGEHRLGVTHRLGPTLRSDSFFNSPCVSCMFM